LLSTFQISFQSRAWPIPKHVLGRWIFPGTLSAFLGNGGVLKYHLEAPLSFLWCSNASPLLVEIFLSVRVELARSHWFNCDDPAETNPTEATTIECGSLLYGRTPLHFAATMGQEHATLYLLQSGASTSIRDLFGSTTYDVAVRLIVSKPRSVRRYRPSSENAKVETEQILKPL
jgi:hypothetical protein